MTFTLLQFYSKVIILYPNYIAMHLIESQSKCNWWDNHPNKYLFSSCNPSHVDEDPRAG